MSTPHQNRLAKASSPYLQQHAHNPVDWYEWGEEALQKAKAEDKPLLISIGYSACHWCHVMEGESYMDQEVADYMNAHFVAVKVDREERPDIDQIYIDAAQMLNGHAGWPLNAFALPDGRPFWVGVYFPKKQWLTVLQQLHKAYTEKYEVVEEQAEALTKGIRQERIINVKTKESTAFPTQDYKALWSTYREKIDFENGGFEGAQKFPMPSAWKAILQAHYLTQNEKALEVVQTTLTAMAHGGIYDQLGGGFSRYATDEGWFAPHFEKMLYDNAQLVSLYAQAFRYTQNPLYKTVVKETLAFVQREMTAENGGFYAALNADSEGEEGKFYVWTTAEICQELTPEEANVFKACYGVTDNGNWENGKNILYCKNTIKTVAQKQEISVTLAKKRLTEAKEKLLAVRQKRIRPSTDDKLLVAWNALMLKAYVEAYRSLGEEAYLNAALKNADFIENNLQRDEAGLYRNFKAGKASIPAFLDDYAFLADAYIALYQVTLEKTWLTRAKTLADYALTHFLDKRTSLFYYTADNAEYLIARKKDVIDNEMPSANAVMAEVLYDLSQYFDLEEYRKISQKMLSRLLPMLKKNALYFGRWSSLLGKISYGSCEVALTGEKALEKLLVIQKEYLPTALYLGGETENLPLLHQKLVKDKTMIYVCRNKTCQQPVEEVAEALQEIKQK